MSAWCPKLTCPTQTRADRFTRLRDVIINNAAVDAEALQADVFAASE
ncbi:MAG: hypothetical protein AAF460_06280 [Pseudomonadota bacterium]